MSACSAKVTGAEPALRHTPSWVEPPPWVNGCLIVPGRAGVFGRCLAQALDQAGKRLRAPAKLGDAPVQGFVLPAQRGAFGGALLD